MPPATAAATATATATVTTAATAPGSAVVSAEQTVCAVSLSAVAARSYPSLDVIMSVDGSGIQGEGGGEGLRAPGGRMAQEPGQGAGPGAGTGAGAGAGEGSAPATAAATATATATAATTATATLFLLKNDVFGAQRRLERGWFSRGKATVFLRVNSQ